MRLHGFFMYMLVSDGVALSYCNVFPATLNTCSGQSLASPAMGCWRLMGQQHLAAVGPVPPSTLLPGDKTI